MKHLRNQLFLCEKDLTIGDKTFKQGECYASASTCNENISMMMNGEFVSVHCADLIVHFKMINSPIVLDCLLKSIKGMKKNTHLECVTNEFVVDSLLRDASVYMNAFKTVAI